MPLTDVYSKRPANQNFTTSIDIDEYQEVTLRRYDSQEHPCQRLGYV